jgi:hypothetical protein
VTKWAYSGTSLHEALAALLPSGRKKSRDARITPGTWGKRMNARWNGTSVGMRAVTAAVKKRLSGKPPACTPKSTFGT